MARANTCQRYAGPLWSVGPAFMYVTESLVKARKMNNLSSGKTLLKNSDGLKWHGGALLYATVGYVAGIAGLFHPSWAINVAATILLAHAMTIAAYMIHECGHNLVFSSIRHNAMLGRFFSWLCGAAYGTYEDMRYNNGIYADVVTPEFACHSTSRANNCGFGRGVVQAVRHSINGSQGCNIYYRS